MRFVTCLPVFAICFSFQTAHADEQLPPVEVTANIIGGTATVPVFMVPVVHLGQTPNQTSAAQYDSLTLDMTKDQVCEMLRDNKPAKCSADSYPPALGINSAYRCPLRRQWLWCWIYGPVDNRTDLVGR